MARKNTGHRRAFALWPLILLAGTSACVYDYPDPVQTTAATSGPVRTQADSAPATGAPKPYSDPQILEQEAKNYAELYRLLRASPGRALLFEVGPLDGPVRGFGKTEKVPAAGQYTVTAACVGAPGAKVAVGQEHPGAPFRPTEIALDCTGASSRVVELQEAYVFTHLVLPGPGDTPWTGAVGGVRVTAAG